MRNAASEQPGLFDPPAVDEKIGEAVLWALGEFQSRGFELAGRKLALDRLLGAIRRAFEEFGLWPVEDSEIAEQLRSAGAEVEELPGYVAKHPFRVTVRKQLSEASLKFYKDRTEAAAAGRSTRE
ncbi:MAG: hypothetical protein IPM63_05755 [Acidobacteriota bacterium]|nr:MAG: hypothetical protein IPM63_05755 [Acidobacteriota bacterium]